MSETADDVREAPSDRAEETSKINIRNLSIKCGQCDTYQTLCAYAPREEWNVYTYECENDVCDPEVTRTLVEVPAHLDEFARRDPTWRGGKRHAGGHAEGHSEGHDGGPTDAG